jgi:hypothetical protein
MTRILMKAVVGATTALMLGGAVQASEVNISISSDRGSYRSVGYYGDDYGYGERRYIRAPSDYGYHHGDRYYGRPVAARPHWYGHDDCRLIIKKRVDPWGNMVVTRIKRCD